MNIQYSIDKLDDEIFIVIPNTVEHINCTIIIKKQPQEAEWDKTPIYNYELFNMGKK